MEKTKIKEYLLTILIQILIIIIYVTCVFFAFKTEMVALEPFKFIVPFGTAMLLIDILFSIIIFRNSLVEDKKSDIIKISMIFFITILLTVTSSIANYSIITKPEFYERFMTCGNEYLEDEYYEEAVAEFKKAIKIEKESISARIGLAKGSVEISDVSTAVIALKEAQKLDFKNEDLLVEIIDILNDDDPNAAYEILMNYVNKSDEDEIGSEIKELLESSKESPQIPQILPESGTYIKPFLLRMKSDKVRVGHVYYYSVGALMPTQSSTPYKNGIKVEEDMRIQFIGYNAEGASTDAFEVNYVIDTSVAAKIKKIIETSKTKLGKTEEGTEVGNCIEGSKQKLQASVDRGETLLEKNAVTLEAGNRMYDELNDGLNEFKQKIIVPTNREALKYEIEKAEEYYDDAVEGSGVGQYRSGAKSTFKTEIKKAKKVYDDILARQENIDKAKSDLTNALKTFEAAKITVDVDRLIAKSGARIGPVTVSLLWDTTDDLDLYVVSPRGDTVYYNSRNSFSGGRLDLDVNGFVSNPVENIYWLYPPRGTYKVKVNVYSKRTRGEIPIIIRTLIDGKPKVYNASVNTGTKTVCTFTY